MFDLGLMRWQARLREEAVMAGASWGWGWEWDKWEPTATAAEEMAHDDRCRWPIPLEMADDDDQKMMIKPI